MLRSIVSQGLSSARRVGVRGYAEAANKVAADKIQLSFALPRTPLYTKQEVTQVNLPTTAGSIGVLASHVPTIEELIPGVVEVIDGTETKQFFVAGGFATVSEGSLLEINAVEGYPLEDFSASEAKSLLSEAQKNVSSSDEDTATQAKIEVEVLEALAAVAK